MTIDELVRVFEVAHYGAANGPANKANMRAGIRAVVEALRDEVVPVAHSYAPTSTMLTRLVREAFDEILVSDGVEAPAAGHVTVLQVLTVKLSGGSDD
jgi:hypothetical protein